MLILQRNRGNSITLLVVLTMLITSGAGIINTIWSLCIVAFLLFCINPSVERKVFYWVIAWGIVLFGNTLMGGGGEILYQDVYVMILRIVCVAVILSHVNFHDFLDCFVKIMCALAILSLLYYIGLLLAPSLFDSFAVVSGNVRGTFVQVHGFDNEASYTRNCGIFWEPGVYQIYLNLAIMLLVFEIVPVEKHRFERIIILSITLITTQSSMGLLCFAITLFSASLFRSNKNKTSLRITSFIMLLILILIEYKYSIVGYKLLDGGGSFSSRIEDLRISISITKSYPIFGTGLLREAGTIWETHRSSMTTNFWGRLANSNGLGACMFKMGIPFTIVHLGLLFKNYYKMAKGNLPIAIVFMLNTVLFFANEPIVFVPFWLMMTSGIQNMSHLNKESWIL